MASQSMPRPSDGRTAVNTEDGFDGDVPAGTRTQKTCRDLKLGRGLMGPNPEAHLGGAIFQWA